MTVGPVARNAATGTFFGGTSEGRFLLRRCRPSGHWCRPQAEVCAECGSTDFEDVAASGRVRLVSWAVVPARRHGDRPAGESDIPAIVEFTEGPWWWSKLVDADPGGLYEGMPLRLLFESAEGGEAVPVFAPDPADGP